MSGPKLTIDEQIEDMKNKGIAFNIVSESEARKFLRNHTYYFKLKAFERNYEKYTSAEKKGRYINLDFACLQELSTLDMYFRQIILRMTLNIEHALKVQILYNLSENLQEDGYSIVCDYFNQDYMRVKRLHDKIGKSASSDLIKKHTEAEDKYALWEIVEVLSFGDFVDLYQLYYSKYPSKESFSSYLWAVKFLRNAAAHNNCLLNSLRTPYNVKINKNRDILNEISKIKSLSEKSRSKWMTNPVVHDFVILVYVYLNVIKSKGLKQRGIEDLKWLFDDRMLKHREYFEKNNSITSCYKFVEKVTITFCNKYRK